MALPCLLSGEQCWEPEMWGKSFTYLPLRSATHRHGKHRHLLLRRLKPVPLASYPTLLSPSSPLDPATLYPCLASLLLPRCDYGRLELYMPSMDQLSQLMPKLPYTDTYVQTHTKR